MHPDLANLVGTRVLVAVINFMGCANWGPVLQSQSRDTTGSTARCY